MLDVEAIIFDIDDTLIPSSRIESDSIKEAYQVIKDQVGGTLSEFVEKMRIIRRRARDKSKYYYTPEHFLEYLKEIEAKIPKDVLATQMFVAYTDKKHETTEPYDAVLPLLEYLRNKAIILLIVSKGDKWNQFEKLVRINVMKFFQTAYFGESEDKSPNLKKAVQDYLLDPEKTIYVGDKPSDDIDSAKKAGLVAIWIKQGRHAKEGSPKQKPDYTFSTISDLFSFLKNELG